MNVGSVTQRDLLSAVHSTSFLILSETSPLSLPTPPPPPFTAGVPGACGEAGQALCDAGPSQWGQEVDRGVNRTGLQQGQGEVHQITSPWQQRWLSQ